jgi:hypothetical protein
MCKWPVHLTTFLWRVCEVLTATAVTVALISVATLGVVTEVIFGRTCDRLQTVLATDTQGRTVVSSVEICSTSDTATVESVSVRWPSGRQEVLLRFVPNVGMTSSSGRALSEPLEPSATWIAPGVLRISMQSVDRILDKREVINGIHVMYEMGGVPFR